LEKRKGGEFPQQLITGSLTGEGKEQHIHAEESQGKKTELKHRHEELRIITEIIYPEEIRLSQSAAGEEKGINARDFERKSKSVKTSTPDQVKSGHGGQRERGMESRRPGERGLENEVNSFND